VDSFIPEFDFSYGSRYGSTTQLAGIVYMQNITNTALYREGCEFNVTKANQYLQESCGSGWPKKTVFVYSHWDEADDPETKEEKLRNGYWSSMAQLGSHMRHFGPPGSFQRANMILSSII
jgi:hypothetical protein